MKPAHLFLLLLLNVLWGSVYSAYKVLGQEMPADSTGTGAIVTLRFGLAAICFCLIWPWLPGSAPRGRDFVATCLLGLMVFVLGQRLQVYGNQLGTAGNSAVLIALEPIVTSVAAAMVLREHIGPRRLAGFTLGMVGIGLLNGVWRPDFNWAGLGPSFIFVSSFICEAIYSVIGKKIILKASIMKMLAISLLVGTAANLLVDGPRTWAVANHLSPQAWLLLLGLAIMCTAVGYTVWFVVIRECPVSVAVLTIFAQSVFGVLIAGLWIGEPLRWEHLFGGLTIAAGLVLGLSRQIRKPNSTL
jgi:drug/metabolite transporter (DMT)-like permease